MLSTVMTLFQQNILEIVSVSVMLEIPIQFCSVEWPWIAGPYPQTTGDGNIQLLKFCILYNPGRWTWSKIVVMIVAYF
jgi:hypothetical protein